MATNSFGPILSPAGALTSKSSGPQPPVRKIPGNYGLPWIGPLSDRLDYFYNQGHEEFFKTRISRHGSTVFRTNMPPGGFVSGDSRVVALLDGRSFPVLFDTEKVEKRDVFTGTFAPSRGFTGGYRVLSYLDVEEEMHGKLKELIFFLLKSRRAFVVPEFRFCYGEFFDDLERELSENGKASFSSGNEKTAFNFLSRSLHGIDPRNSSLGNDAPKLIAKWLLLQLSPLLTLGLPKFIEEILLHTFPFPPALAKKEYERLYDFFGGTLPAAFEEADRLGISRDEACHNFLFATCFNSFGGIKIFFPNLIKWIGRAGAAVHERLAKEVRSVVGSDLKEGASMIAMEKMPLVKSVVYEALRIEPPVASQYGRARRDLFIESHDSMFPVKEGEMLFGYQPFATKDPKIFNQSEQFISDRFVGDGEKLLRHVLWSNGPETQKPTTTNKQCAGKDFVVMAGRLLVIELFRRYDSFDIEVGSSPIGADVSMMSLKRAST